LKTFGPPPPQRQLRRPLRQSDFPAEYRLAARVADDFIPLTRGMPRGAARIGLARSAYERFDLFKSSAPRLKEGERGAAERVANDILMQLESSRCGDADTFAAKVAYLIDFAQTELDLAHHHPNLLARARAAWGTEQREAARDPFYFELEDMNNEVDLFEKDQLKEAPHMGSIDDEWRPD
jgi:hypothetical protein